VPVLIKNDPFLKAFGRRIKELRLAKGISQEDLANTAEIPISQVGRIERGEINTTLVTIKALADALQINTELFFKNLDKL
jgi:transcriptional regulator with XRE-family HTH domain